MTITQIWIPDHFHLPHHCRMKIFRRFINISHTVTKMTDANKVRTPQHFGSVLKDKQIWIRINPKIYSMSRKKAAPYVKYSNTHNTEQKSLTITENTLTSIWTLCAILWVQFQDRDIIICFQRHTKNAIFQNKTISVEYNEQSVKQSRCSKCPLSALTHSRSRVRYW